MIRTCYGTVRVHASSQLRDATSPVTIIRLCVPIESDPSAGAPIPMINSKASPRPDPWHADAVRYRMLWRLVPSVNHKLAGSMQPITMFASMFARQLQRPQPDIQTLSKQAADMQLACKAAIKTRTEVMTWFQPSETILASVGSEVTQCTRMLTAEFAIRGSSVDNLVGPNDAMVQQSCVRTMLMAALFAILDDAKAQVTVQLSTPAESSDSASVVASWRPAVATAADLPQHSSSAPVISWADVQALADQLEVGMQLSATQVTMRFASAR